nr:Chain A, PaDBS1R2 [Pyrobaculum aerophilum str. IM2]
PMKLLKRLGKKIRLAAAFK